MPNTRSNSTTDSCSPDKLESIKEEILLEFQNFRNTYERDISELKTSLSELKCQNTTLKKKVKELQNEVK